MLSNCQLGELSLEDVHCHKAIEKKDNFLDLDLKSLETKGARKCGIRNENSHPGLQLML